MFSLVGKNLTAGVQDIVAMRSDTMDVVTGFAESAISVRTCFIFHVLLEAVFGQSFVFYMIGFVFLCKWHKLLLLQA